MRKEPTVLLAKSLQCCAEWSGTMCSTVRDLQRCLAPLIQHEEEDICVASSVEPVGEDPMASPTPAVKAKRGS